MVKKQLLCVALGDASLFNEHAGALQEWEVCIVASLKEANRVLRARGFLVGLLHVTLQHDAVDEVDRFLREHWAMQWIGVFPAQALKSTLCRQLVLDHFCDFHTLPIDIFRLNHTLGHAHGYAALRQTPGPRSAQPRDMALKGESAAISRLRQQIVKVASASAPVLIWGESGTGKELVAHAIHSHSVRAARPFVPINCGAIPSNLIQSELFGHERGAFTGAAKEKLGLIESAAGGTIFLDEIGDLPMELQSNFLRFLQEKTIYRVGSTHSIELDVRVIAASHVNLQEAVSNGSFREDLYYRLNVLALDVPPLRERKDDLVLLANHFFSQFSSERAPRVKGFSAKAFHSIVQHDWPGNVRELINRIRRAMVMAEGPLIAPEDLGLELQFRQIDGAALDGARTRAERDAVLASVQKSGKNISRAARDLGISRMTLYRLLAKHGLRA